MPDSIFDARNLTASFVVNQWGPSQLQMETSHSKLLRHSTETVLGHFEHKPDEHIQLYEWKCGRTMTGYYSHHKAQYIMMRGVRIGYEALVVRYESYLP